MVFESEEINWIIACHWHKSCWEKRWTPSSSHVNPRWVRDCPICVVLICLRMSLMKLVVYLLVTTCYYFAKHALWLGLYFSGSSYHMENGEIMVLLHIFVIKALTTKFCYARRQAARSQHLKMCMLVLSKMIVNSLSKTSM